MNRPSVVPDALRTTPFSAAMARDLGGAAHVLRGKRFRSPFRGVYVWHELPDTFEVRVDAARLILPASALASHLTSVQLLGGRLPYTPEPNFLGAQASRRGVHTRYATARVPAATRSSSSPGADVDSAGEDLDRLRGAARPGAAGGFGDSLVRGGRITPEQLRQAALEIGRRHVRKTRLAAHLVRERVDSWQGSRTRMLIVLGDLPEPETGLPVYDSCGEWLATPDMSYRELKIAVKYDGRHHDDDRRQRSRDVLRNELLVADGWWLVIVRAGGRTTYGSVLQRH